MTAVTFWSFQIKLSGFASPNGAFDAGPLEMACAITSFGLAGPEPALMATMHLLDATAHRLHNFTGATCGYPPRRTI